MDIIKTLVIAAAASIVVGCGSDSDHTPTTQVRVTHASPDAPLVNVKANGGILSGLENIDYREGKGVLTLDAGTYDLAVEAIIPDGDPLVVLDAKGTNLMADMRYDIVAIDNVDTSSGVPTVKAAIIERSIVKPDVNSVRLAVLHAHPKVGNVDIYLTTESSIVGENPSLENLPQFESVVATVGAGDVRIRITPQGSKTVVFDTGTTNLSLAGGSDILVVASQNNNNGDADSLGVSLLLGINEDKVTTVNSASDNGTVRAVHAAYAVDSLVDVRQGDPKSVVTALSGLTFKQPAKSVALGQDDYNIDAIRQDNSAEAIAATNLSVKGGSVTTIYAVEGNLNPLVFEDKLRSIISQATVRVIHAHPSVGAKVDVHVKPSSVANFSDSTLVLENIDYGAVSDQLALSGGTYDLAVTATGTLTPVLTLTATLEDGGVYTVYATTDPNNTLGASVDTAPAP
jgi:hypothetical protein